MEVLVTGAEGFLGKNLLLKLKEKSISVIPITRKSTPIDLANAVENASCVIHLAGANRPEQIEEFNSVNAEFTRKLCSLISLSGKKLPIIYASSTQAGLDNAYGMSKRMGEEILLDYNQQTGASVSIYRLPNVFGKWCKPNYNSVVATFCHNTANNLPIQINDANATINLVYVDDLIEEFIKRLFSPGVDIFCELKSVYSRTIGELAEQIHSFKLSRESGIIPNVGTGFVRALYATYVSYLKEKQFSYGLTKHEDARGLFVEMLKTQEAGQFSYFTAYPGITRGGHYHHTKTEKFLVVEGEARFSFQHIISGEFYQHCTSGESPEIVQTVPGWTHDITNIGKSKMIVLLWANEVFDRNKPDTVIQEIKK